MRFLELTWVHILKQGSYGEQVVRSC